MGVEETSPSLFRNEDHQSRTRAEGFQTGMPWQNSATDFVPRIFSGKPLSAEFWHLLRAETVLRTLGIKAELRLAAMPPGTFISQF